MLKPYLSRLRPAEPGRLHPRRRSRFEPAPGFPIDGPAIGPGSPPMPDAPAADVEIELGRDAPFSHPADTAVTQAAPGEQVLPPARTAAPGPAARHTEHPRPHPRPARPPARPARRRPAPRRSPPPPHRPRPRPAAPRARRHPCPPGPPPPRRPPAPMPPARRPPPAPAAAPRPAGTTARPDRSARTGRPATAPAPARRTGPAEGARRRARSGAIERPAAPDAVERYPAPCALATARAAGAGPAGSRDRADRRSGAELVSGPMTGRRPHRTAPTRRAIRLMPRPIASRRWRHGCDGPGTPRRRREPSAAAPPGRSHRLCGAAGGDRDHRADRGQGARREPRAGPAAAERTAAASAQPGRLPGVPNEGEGPPGMSNNAAIAAVTATLTNMIQAAVSADTTVSSGTVTAVPPTRRARERRSTRSTCSSTGPRSTPPGATRIRRPSGPARPGSRRCRSYSLT